MNKLLSTIVQTLYTVMSFTFALYCVCHMANINTSVETIAISVTFLIALVHFTSDREASKYKRFDDLSRRYRHMR